jgi:hypothetical protein
MSFRLNDFRTALANDGARPNLFKVEIPRFPDIAAAAGAPGVTTGGQTAARKLSFMARASQLPGSTVNQVPVMYFGREVKFSGNRTFSDFNITVINDEDFLIRNSFEAWLAGLNSHSANLRDPRAINNVGYQCNAFVTQYSKDGEEIKKYRFIGLFPTDLTPIELDWSSNDTIEEFAVTFSYQWWESVLDFSDIGFDTNIP